jgi:hypothetical protein
MTLKELHRNFKIELDKSEISSYPSFLPEEIDYWINNSIERFVKTRYSGRSIDRAGFQQTEKRTDDLRTLVVEKSYDTSNVIQDVSNSIEVDYPSDYMIMVGESTFITSDASSWPIKNGVKAIQRVDPIEATIENIDSKLQSVLSEHNLRIDSAKPIRLFVNNKVRFYTDGNYRVVKYVMTYIKNPEKLDWYSSTVSIDDAITMLPEHTWSEIIVLAVGLALENISDIRLNSYASNALTSE